MKRLICILLSLVMLLPLVACASDVPSDYQLVSLERDPFNLYVPKTWRDNSSSGMATAYYSGDHKIMVSGFSEKQASGETLSAFVNRMDKTYGEELENYEKRGEIKETTLGGNAAYRMEYYATLDGEAMNFCSVYALYDTYFVTVTYCALATFYADRMEDFEGILSHFTFKQPVILPPATDGEGNEYVLASHEKNVFKFYVPASWTILDEGQIVGASVNLSNGDRSNVTLMEYVSGNGIETAEQYWELYKEQNDDIEVISTDKNVKLGKYDAFAAEYKTVMGETAYKVKQIFLATADVIYVMSYISTEEFYNAHLDEVAKMAEMFEFK